MQLCSNDWQLVISSNCREADVTLAFEAYVLTLLPSALFTFYAIQRIRRLSRTPVLLPPFRKLALPAQLLVAAKALAGSASVVASAVILLQWSISYASQESLAGTIALSFFSVSMVFSCLVSAVEHFRSPATFGLSLYLSWSLLVDAVVYRSLHRIGSIPFSLLLGSGARFAWLILEHLSKKGSLAQDDHHFTSEETSTFVSRLTFTWILPLLIRGARTKLNTSEMPPVAHDLDSRALYEEGQNRLAREHEGMAHPLVWTISKSFPGPLLAPLLPAIICAFAEMSRPLLINRTILFVQSHAHGSSLEEGLVLVALTLLSGLLFAFSRGQWLLAVSRGSVCIRGYLLEAIYRKGVTVHAEVAKETGAAKIANLASMDIDRILDQFSVLYQLVNALIMVLLGAVQIYFQVGLASFGALLGLVLVTATMPVLTRNIGQLQGDWSDKTDARTRLVASVLRQLRAIKYSAFELPLMATLGEARQKELKAKISFFTSMTAISTVSNFGSRMQSLLTVGFYVLLTRLVPSTPPLTAARLFTTLAVVGLVSAPLSMLGQASARVAASWQSFRRIESFLLSQTSPILHESTTPGTDDISLTGASFGVDGKALLQNISTVIRAGQMTFVIGRVGSGKTTFLRSLLGETDLLSGDLSLPATSSAFCSQTPWLRAETIRSAIVFVADFDGPWYQEVLRAVAIDVDIALLAAGDSTMTSSLSGGQRARVALARAIYSKADRLFLDDVFAALDNTTADRVQATLFDSPNGLLRGRTVVLTTNDPSLFTCADLIIALAAGVIAEQGRPKDLIARGGVTANLVKELGGKARRAVKNAQEEAAASEQDVASVPIEDDEGKQHNSGWRPYRTYLAATGGWTVLVYSLLTLISGSAETLISIYLGMWSNRLEQTSDDLSTVWFAGYAVIQTAAALVFAVLFWFATSVSSPKSGRVLHDAALRGVLSAPLSALEQYGPGSLLNRFASDTSIVDFALVMHSLNFTSNSVDALAAIAVVLVVAPPILLPLAGVAVALLLVQGFYTRSSQQLRRLELGARSPLVSLLDETISYDGLATLRAFGGSAHHVDLNSKRIGLSQRPHYTLEVAQRWFGTFLDLASAVLNALLTLIAVLRAGQTSIGLVSVALLYGSVLTGSIDMVLTSWVETETCIVAVERLDELAHLPVEASSALEHVEVEAGWPQHGRVELQDVSARYSFDSGLVLRNVSLSVPAGSRVGVVGRTGSGKSTLLACLFRMLDVESGTIQIDGLDISTISRSTLRSSMSIVSQDPLALETSVRLNLDILGLHDDCALWDALDRCSMKDVVRELPEQLDSVGEFSQGQRQLLSLARALLENRRILVLDEATSSLDSESDQTIRRALATSFQRSTIITVAHRVSTVLEADLIFVMDAGQLVESGQPQTLLNQSQGYFRKLVQGEEAQEVL